MSSSSKKLKTTNIKKNERHIAKKRKLEAFLNLVRNQDTSIPKKKIDDFKESYKTLRDELKHFQKNEVDPLFYPTDCGRSAEVKFSSNAQKLASESPLFIEDIYHLLLKSVLGNLSPVSLKWAKLERPQNISKTVVIEIDGLLEEHIFKMNSELNCNSYIFRYIFEVISSTKPFATELCTMHLVENFYSQTQGKLATFYPMKEVKELHMEKIKKMEELLKNKEIINSSVDQINITSQEKSGGHYKASNKKEIVVETLEDGEIMDSFNERKKDVVSTSNETVNKFDRNYNVSKLHLLLSPIQLAMENFPLPQNVFRPSKSAGYKFSKESYTPVTENSPMFAVDCEMCLTTNKLNELTRVAIVNEDLETVYETLVKPKAMIINYLTKYSGITKAMLKDVTTTLEDVQNDMRNLLPSDAILVGQSLNSDMHALKLMHPYVIDTSVIFNNAGVRNRKVSLKNLVKEHLNEVIQDATKIGHHPVEDSVGAMKLAQFKLQKSLQYGDRVLLNSLKGTNKKYRFDNNKNNFKGNENQKVQEYVQLNTGPENCGFFERIAKYFKKACLVGNEDALSNYHLVEPSENIIKVIKSSNSKVVKAISDNLNDNNLIISHLQLSSKLGTVDEINECVKQLFDNLPKNTLFILLAGKDADIHFKHRFCMAILKDRF